MHTHTHTQRERERDEHESNGSSIDNDNTKMRRGNECKYSHALENTRIVYDEALYACNEKKSATKKQPALTEETKSERELGREREREGRMM